MLLQLHPVLPVPTLSISCVSGFTSYVSTIIIGYTSRVTLFCHFCSCVKHSGFGLSPFLQTIWLNQSTLIIICFTLFYANNNYIKSPSWDSWLLSYVSNRGSVVLTRHGAVFWIQFHSRSFWYDYLIPLKCFLPFLAFQLLGNL